MITTLTGEAMKKKAASIRHEYSAANDMVKIELANLARYAEARKVAEAVATIVSDASQAAQAHFGGVVAGVVTQCLNSVYPNNPYEFRLEFRECGGKTVVDTLLYRDGESLDPMSSTGGGVWDILAFALRVALMILTSGDTTRKLLVLDEPFKFLHGGENIRRAYETMEMVGEQFGLTILCARQH